MFIPKIRRVASNTFWSNQESIFRTNTSSGWRFKNESRRTTFASLWNNVKNSSSWTSHTLLSIPDGCKRGTSNTSHLAFRVMRISRTFFTCSSFLIPMFWLETTYTLKSSVIGKLFWTLTFFHFDVELICFWACKAHSCSVIPVMRIITSDTFSIVFKRSGKWTFALFNLWVINIGVWTVSTRVRYCIPIVWIGARCAFTIL